MSLVNPALFIAAPLPGGIAAGILKRRNTEDWYQHLKQPSWRPPRWAPAPMWAIMYSGSGYASYLVWRDGGGFGGRGRNALAIYGTCVALNWLWAPIFLSARRMDLAFFEIMGLWGTIAACVHTFKPINKTASYLMIPYLAWISYAAALNYSVWRNNPGDVKAIKKSE